MSQENLDLVRRAVEAFNDRDIPALESIYSEGYVYRLIGGFADLMGTEFRGLDAALAWMKEWIEAIDARAEIETIRQVNDQVLTIMNIAATGAASAHNTPNTSTNRRMRFLLGVSRCKGYPIVGRSPSGNIHASGRRGDCVKSRVGRRRRVRYFLTPLALTRFARSRR